ncbi:hypothetical protein ES332_A13G042600v1 [Gossypium tomentosum]|uniref:Uncharacterized protein n=1 Tax=Gossypium tomentosum TaxID=34277 RepID=A0A5D2MFX2_GOSTO|nr:hypothetical protein ES332_A13G042600v1 [Gossypium tomentosum]
MMNCQSYRNMKMNCRYYLQCLKKMKLEDSLILTFWNRYFVKPYENFNLEFALIWSKQLVKLWILLCTKLEFILLNSSLGASHHDDLYYTFGVSFCYIIFCVVVTSIPISCFWYIILLSCI